VPCTFSWVLFSTTFESVQLTFIERKENIKRVEENGGLVMIEKKRTISCLVCPTRYRTRHFFNNCNTNEDIATKFEQGYVRCVRNEEECVCSVGLECD
jgi:hypothetical protein